MRIDHGHPLWVHELALTLRNELLLLQLLYLFKLVRRLLRTSHLGACLAQHSPRQVRILAHVLLLGDGQAWLGRDCSVGRRVDQI